MIDATIPSVINCDVGGVEDGDSGEDSEEEEQWTTPMEDEQMSKRERSVFTSKGHFWTKQLPTMSPWQRLWSKEKVGLQRHQMVGARHGWLHLKFGDDTGISKFGVWCSPLQLTPVDAEAPSTFKGTQEVAKMATVAIRLRHALGSRGSRDNQDANKCGVMTNWWRERVEKGQCALPKLSFWRNQ